jgi:hypothetical protein
VVEPIEGKAQFTRCTVERNQTKGFKMTGRAMVLIAGFALLGAPGAIAQEDSTGESEMRHRAPRAEMRHRAPHPEAMFDRALGRMMDRQNELNLSDDQMAALGDLRADARSALAPVREEMKSIHDAVRDGSLSREDAGERMKGIREQTKESMKALHDRLGETLDEEQMHALHRGGQARHGSRRAAAHRGRPGRHGRSESHGRPERRGEHPAPVGS